MKNLLVVVALVCMCLIGFSGTAWADKPTEAVVYHCGCEVTDDGLVTADADLVWKGLIVSSNSKGHRKHQEDDVETCTFDDDIGPTFDDITRGFDDCQDESNDPSLSGVSDCDDPANGGDFATEGVDFYVGDLCDISQQLPD